MMRMKSNVVAMVLVAGCVGGSNGDPTSATTQAVSGPGSVDSARVPANFLQGATLRHGDGASGRHKEGAAFSSGVPGIDSIQNFVGSFTTPGFDGAGSPQSVWPYSMVGAPPSQNRATQFRAPVVPVTVELLDASGNVASAPNGSPLRMVVGPDTIDATVKSPVFGTTDYNSGRGQFNDQMMRTMFWNQFPHHGDSDEHGYHTVLNPVVRTTRTVRLAFGSYRYATKPDGSCCAFILADANAFSDSLFPATSDDTTTVLGAAENSHDITTRDITTLLFKDVYLYQGDPSNCCILGFHSYDVEPGDASNGNRERRFVMNFASYISPNLFSFGFQDVTAFSHEVAELFADPFVDNATPWWLSQDPVLGSALCQNNLETGDVIEVLSTPVYPVAMNGRTYHPSNEAMLPWFAFQSPSTARAGAYSFPDETVLPNLSPGPLQVGCAAPATP